MTQVLSERLCFANNEKRKANDMLEQIRGRLGIKQRIRYLIGRYSILYYSIFKVIIPFLLSMMQLDYICALIVIRINKISLMRIDNLYLTFIVYLAFISILIFLPRLATGFEYFFHLLFVAASLFYGATRTYLVWIAMICTIVLLVGKIVFYLTVVFEIDGEEDFYDDMV